jgi:hypothetical protein
MALTETSPEPAKRAARLELKEAKAAMQSGFFSESVVVMGNYVAFAFILWSYGSYMYVYVLIFASGGVGAYVKAAAKGGARKKGSCPPGHR